MSIFGITLTDLQNATSVATMLALMDDGSTAQPGGTGTPSATAVAAIIDRGEQEVLSWLGDELGPLPFTAQMLTNIGQDPLLKYAAIEYIVALAYDRHPEYPQADNGNRPRRWRFDRADERMKRILEGRQRPTVLAQQPANVGGAVVDNGPRIYSDDAQGNTHSGDY